MPELPPVTERFVADDAQFVAALEEMAAAAQKVADAVGKINAELAAAQRQMDAMAAGAAEAAAAEENLAKAEQDVASSAAGAAAGLAAEAGAVRDLAVAWTEEAAAQAAAAAGAEAFGRDVAAAEAAFEAFMGDRLRASIQNLENDLYVIGHSAGELDPVATALGDMEDHLHALGLSATAAVRPVEDAAGAAGRAAIGFRLWGFGLGLTRNALHWVVAGTAEFLAVAIPATYALVAGLAVAAQGAQNVQQHFSALYAATESTYAAFHQTTGSVLGLGSALQNAQNAADPGVYEVLGAAINSAKTQFGDFAGIGLQVVHMFDTFAARVTVDMQGALGTKLHGLLDGAVTDLQQFGQVIGNIGHALLNFAAAMPGLAHVLLDIAQGLSAVIRWASQGGVFITMAMGLEEMYRWGGLAASMLVRMLGLTAAMNAMGSGGFIFRFGAALLALAQGAGMAVQWLGRMVASMTLFGNAALVAGGKIEGFGMDMRIAAATASPLAVAAFAAVAAGVGFLAYKIITAKSATQQWADASSQMVAKANDLTVLPTIYTQLADTATRLASSIQQTGTAFRDQSSMIRAAGDSWRTQNDTYHQAIGNNQVLAQHMMSLISTANTVRSNIGLLAGVFHTSAIGALALANAAGVNLTVGMTKGSEAAKIAAQQITNLRTGLGAMSAPIGVIGADMQAVGIQSQLASSKVGTVNQAMDAFIASTTGGMNSVMQFNAALHAMGADTAATSQSVTGAIRSISADAAKMGFTLQGIGPKAQQSWQQFDAALVQGNTVLDTFRTGMAEGVVSAAQYQNEIRAVGGAMLPFAAHSGTALHMVSQLAQELGLPATGNLKTLAADFGITGKAAQNMATVGMEKAIAGMSNLNLVARNLSATVSGQLDTAMASAIVSASGLDQKYKQWATDVMNGRPAATLAGDLRNIRTAQDQVNAVESKATTLLNSGAKAAGSYGSALKGAAGDAGGLTGAVSKTHAALADVVARARDAGVSTQGFGQQARTAAGSAQGLTGNANQANTAVKALGTSATVTRGSLGTVNNEIRTTASAAGAAQGPLGAMSGAIRNVGASAAAAAGQVRGLEAAIASLQSKTVTVNVVTVTSTVHRALGGPVFPGVPTVVGEMGREMYIPAASGYIIPHAQTEQILAGSGGTPAAGGGGTIQLTAEIHTHALLDSKEVFTSIKPQVFQWMKRNRGAADGVWAPS